jgi:hypothetical protein
VEPHGQGGQPDQLRILRNTQRHGADTDTDPDADTDTDTDTDTYADTDPDPHAHAHAHAHADTHADTYADPDTYADAHTHADTYADPDAGEWPDGTLHGGLEVADRCVLHARGHQQDHQASVDMDGELHPGCPNDDHPVVERHARDSRTGRRRQGA